MRKGNAEVLMSGHHALYDGWSSAHECAWVGLLHAGLQLPHDQHVKLQIMAGRGFLEVLLHWLRCTL